jgi:hypothetical protein
MNHCGHWLRLLLMVMLATALLLVAATPAPAQCSMCKAVLSGSNNAHFIRNFNIGVLVLLLPPVTIFCSIFVVLKRHRGEENPESEAEGCETDDHDRNIMPFSES